MKQPSEAVLANSGFGKRCFWAKEEMEKIINRKIKKPLLISPKWIDLK